MRATIMLVLVSALLGCGPGIVEPVANPVRCEPGPELTIQREPCPIIVEGSGGPSSAELLTIATTDGTVEGGISPAHDGGVYVRFEADIIARLGPELEPMWSRALIYEWPSVGGSRQAVSEWGVDVITSLRQQPDERTSWHTHIDDAGNCDNATALVLGGDPQAVILSHVRDGEHLAYGGILLRDNDIQHALVQLVAGGSPVAEVELVTDHGYIDQLELLTDGSKRLLVAHQTYEPQGSWSYSLGATWLDETLTIVGGSNRGYNHLGYQRDVHGRIHSLTRDGSEWEEPPAPTPTSITITRLDSPTAPGGEPLLRAIPIDCEYMDIEVRDDALQVVLCRDEPRLRGYTDTGPDPSWSLTLGCPDLDILQLKFDASERLWLLGRLDGEARALVLRW